MALKLPPFGAIRAFEATVRLGTTVAAAAELGVTHSAVSRQIGQLEEWIGRPLFGREAGRLVASDDGVQYAQTVRQALDLLHEGTRSIEDRSESMVRVSTTASFAAEWLVPRLPLFHAAHPSIEVWVEETKDRVDPRSGGCDIAIRMGSGRGFPRNAEPLMDDHLVAVCTPDLASKLAHLNDLLIVPLLHDRDPEAQWSRWASQIGWDIAPAASEALNRGPRFASSSLLIRAAAAGQGVALVHVRLAEAWLADGRLARPFAQTVDLGATHWLVTREARDHRRPLRLFMAWLRSQAIPICRP